MTYLFYLYVLLVPLEYLQEKIPKGPTGVNYLNVMMIVMLLWWLFAAGKGGKRQALPTPLNGLLMLFLGYSYLGLFLTALTVPGADMPLSPQNESFMFFIRLVNGMLFFWLAANMLKTRQAVRWCLYAIGLSMPLVWRAFRSDIGMHSVAAYRNELRFQGPFVYIGSNELAALFLIGCIFYGLFALAQRRWWEKAAFLGASGLYAYGVLYSYSRGTQLALILVAVLVASLRYRWILAVLLLALVTNQWWVPKSVRERWEMTEDESGQLDASAESRKEFWSLAWDLFGRSPAFGHGVQSFRRINPARMDAHNLYMRTLAEQGIIGIVLLFALWIHVLKLAYSLWTHAPERWDRQFGFALFMTTLGLMVANIFGDRFTHLAVIGQYWAMVGLAQRIHANMTGVEAFDDDPAAIAAAQQTGEGSAATVPASSPHGASRPLPGLKPRPALALVGAQPPAPPYAPAPASGTSAPRTPETVAGPAPEAPRPVPPRHKGERPPLNIVGRESKPVPAERKNG
jgi:O-antigen ligase